MFNIGDYVVHKQTGSAGKVMAYGHQMRDGVYLPTLVVKVEQTAASQTRFIEDLSSVWRQLDCQQKQPTLQVSSTKPLAMTLKSATRLVS